MKQLLPLLVPFLLSSAFAQTSAVRPTPYSACGPVRIMHKVTTSDDVSIPEAATGMATLVFIEDEFRQRPGHAPCLHCADRVRLGMDGQWVAVNSGFSHQSISIAPGEHHFCADVDSADGEDPQPAMYGMQIEPNKTYFLRARLSLIYVYNVHVLELEPVNEDEGRFMVSTSKQSSFRPK